MRSKILDYLIYGIFLAMSGVGFMVVVLFVLLTIGVRGLALTIMTAIPVAMWLWFFVTFKFDE